MDEPIKITFAIVNWNGGEVFKNCLASIQLAMSKTPFPQSYEIIVVDNASSDLDFDWLTQQPHTRLVRNKENLLFAKATNQSVKMAEEGSLLFILNNDVILNEQTLINLLNSKNLDRYDAIAVRMYYPDGRNQKTMSKIPNINDIILAGSGLSSLWPPLNSWINPYFDYDKPQETFLQPMFSALVMPRKTWDRVGDLDERLPLLWNDTDWFFRFYKLGLKCFYEPTATVVHHHGMSTNRNRFKKIRESIKSMRIFFDKHYQLGFREAILLAVFSTSLKFLAYILETTRYIKDRRIFHS